MRDTGILGTESNICPTGTNSLLTQLSWQLAIPHHPSGHAGKGGILGLCWNQGHFIFLGARSLVIDITRV